MGAVYQLTVLPAGVQRLLDVIRVTVSMGFDGLGSLLGCTGVASPVNVLLFWLTAPMVITLAVSAGALAWATTRRQDGPSGVRLAVLTALRPTLVVLYAFYPIVSSVAFQAFACESLGDVSMRYLPPDYTLECGPAGEPTAEYQRLVELAAVAIALYPLGISVFTAVLLFLAREPLRSGLSTDFTRAIAFLHQEYEPSFFWWEVCGRFRTRPPRGPCADWALLPHLGTANGTAEEASLGWDCRLYSSRIGGPADVWARRCPPSLLHARRVQGLRP